MNQTHEQQKAQIGVYPGISPVYGFSVISSVLRLLPEFDNRQRSVFRDVGTRLQG